MSPRFRRLGLFFLLPLVFYFSVYTWNWKTGYLDRLSTVVGLEVAGWVLKPGRWLQHSVEEFWSRYIYLVGVRQKNEDLTLRLRSLELELAHVAEKAKFADRVSALLDFSPEASWKRRGCRVIGQRLGPDAVLETMLVDVGTYANVNPNDPVISPKGVVGRIAKSGLHFSTVLLLTDPTSRIPVITSTGRIPAIVQGQGANALLDVKFIPRNNAVMPGEMLLTSGQGGIFPKGLPVAEIVSVTSTDASLFQKVQARPVQALRYYEELLVLSPEPVADAPVQPGPASANATIPESPVPSVSDAVVPPQG